MSFTKTITLFTVLASLAVASIGPAAAQFIVIGSTGTFNAFPFSPGNYTGEYQQIYDSSAFPGIVEIQSISFSSSSVAGSPGSGNYDLSVGLSNTASSVAAPDPTFAANKGADFTTVFSGTFSATFTADDTFDLVFPITPFVYHPLQGNLLLDVFINSSSGDVEAFNSGFSPQVSRVFTSNGGSVGSTDGEALITRFGATLVPEGRSLALLAVGVIPLATLSLRRVRGRGR